MSAPRRATAGRRGRANPTAALLARAARAAPETTHVNSASSGRSDTMASPGSATTRRTSTAPGASGLRSATTSPRKTQRADAAGSRRTSSVSVSAPAAGGGAGAPGVRVGAMARPQSRITAVRRAGWNS